MSRLTSYPNGLNSFLVDSNAEEKTSNYTVIINDDSGKTFTASTDGFLFALPAIAIGNTVTFVNTADDASATLVIIPNATDAITYKGTSVDAKFIFNLKAVSKQGDFITLASLDGVIAWQVVAVRGIWDKEA